MIQTVERIGMSLKPRYLAGDPDALECSLFGPPDVFLSELAAASVTSIELRAISPNTPIEQARAAIEQVWDAGLDVTIHGALPPRASGDDWPETIPALVDLAELLRDRGLPQRCPITVHCYADPDGDAATLADATATRLRQIADWIESEGLPITVALEINRAKATVDPSVTYQGVLDMQQAVGSRHVGVCWDFGHTWANILNAGLDAEPPSAFAAATTHTHIHDLGPTGRTHWPLTEARLPLASFVRALQRQGYEGVWNLELGPDRFKEEGAVRERVLASIERLREALQACRPN